MTILPPVEEAAELNQNPVLYWNHVGLELNRLTHSIGGPQTGPTMSSRALGILHLAIHDAYFAIETSVGSTYLSTDPNFLLPDKGGADDAVMAVAGAAITVLEAFYSRRNTGSNFSRDVSDQLDQLLRRSINAYPNLDALTESYQFGADVGTAILRLLAIKPDEPGADQGQYRPKDGRFFFRDEPSNPVRLVPIDANNPDGPKRAARIYHAPFYGMTAKRFAVQQDDIHVIADPPKGSSPGEVAEYTAAVREVTVMGGAPNISKTVRTPDQTVAAYYWAYDGANLIGTPPRLYNQIVRKIAWEKKTQAAPDAPENTAEFARLFALVNTAMADAGILAWREKYCFEFWRPLSGVREHDGGSGPAPQTGNEHLEADADPFWQTLGAPETNTDRVSFKPPFPAYPSGHATFGAASLQMVRLFYKDRDSLAFADDEPDAIAFDFVSEELNGVNRDLRQPYNPDQPITEQPGLVRTRVVRNFKSLWAAILENAASRVFLGVHWRFDSFAAQDVIATVRPDGSTEYKDSDDVKYETTGPRADRPGDFPIGGAPLGLGIANAIYHSNLVPTPVDQQPTGRKKCGFDTLADSAPDASAVPDKGSVTPKASQTNIR